MNHISSHLAELLQDNHPEYKWKFQLILQWQNIMGSLADKVTIQKINQNSIVLGVIDSCWMQEMLLLSNLIKEKINTQLGRPQIQTIKFCYKNNIQEKKQKSSLQTLQKTTYTMRPQEEQALKIINDQELQEALQGFLKKCHQYF